jgi:hypothetical protein
MPKVSAMIDGGEQRLLLIGQLFLRKGLARQADVLDQQARRRP